MTEPSLEPIDRTDELTTISLRHRLTAEAVGTALLVTAAVGSGIAAQRLSDDGGVQLLANAVVTGAALAALITMLAPISGAHFNPAVTLTARFNRTISTREASAYVMTQVAGGIGGVALANIMFELPALHLATTERSSAALWVSEAVATVALLLLVGSLSRHPTPNAPFVIGAWIAGAFWFTSSTSFANPAVTTARMFSDTSAGIAPTSAGAFVAVQIAAVAIALAADRFMHPATAIETSATTGRPS
ncbi:MAG: aquaporin [Microthrixaceae bacterium]